MLPLNTAWAKIGTWIILNTSSKHLMLPIFLKKDSFQIICANLHSQVIYFFSHTVILSPTLLATEKKKMEQEECLFKKWCRRRKGTARHKAHFSPCSAFSIICHGSLTNRQPHILQISLPSSVKLLSTEEKLKKEKVSFCSFIGKKEG